LTALIGGQRIATMLRRVVPTLRQSANNNAVRGFSTNNVDLPRITERRRSEVGRGGRASDAGIKVAVFGATGFLGRYVCSGLGKLLFGVIVYRIIDCLVALFDCLISFTREQFLLQKKYNTTQHNKGLMINAFMELPSDIFHCC